MLSIEGLHVGYAGVDVLRGVDIQVAAGELVALLGPNGVGKTTMVRAVMGLLQPHRGRICFNGTDLKGMKPEQIVRLGVALVPEGRRVFPRLTVAENLALGGTPLRDPAQRRQAEEYVLSLFPVLGQRRHQMAGTLSGGEQQMLAIGRALMSNPRLLILDEPSLGLAPRVVQMTFDQIRAISQNGTTILLIEQNVKQALRVASRVYLMKLGRIALSGTPAEVAAGGSLQDVYLSRDHIAPQPATED